MRLNLAVTKTFLKVIVRGKKQADEADEISNNIFKDKKDDDRANTLNIKILNWMII